MHPSELATKSARDQYTVEHIPLVLRAVKKFLDRHPHLAHLRKDLIQAGQIGLVKAIKRMSAKEVLKPRLYMTMAIGREIQTCVDDEESIRIPTRTKNERKKNGEEIETMDRELYDEMKLDKRPSRYRSAEDIEAEDWIFGLCRTERERKIIELKLLDHNCTLEEIGQRLEVHTSTVSRDLKKLELRVDVGTLRQRGYEVKDISAKLGIDEATVSIVFAELDGPSCEMKDTEKVEVLRRNRCELDPACLALAT